MIFDSVNTRALGATADAITAVTDSTHKAAVGVTAGDTYSEVRDLVGVVVGSATADVSVDSTHTSLCHFQPGTHDTVLGPVADATRE